MISQELLIGAAQTSDQDSSGQTNLASYLPERPFRRSLARYTLQRRSAPFIYTCFSAQVIGRETRVHAGRLHVGHSLRRTLATHCHIGQPHAYTLTRLSARVSGRETRVHAGLWHAT